MFTLLAYSSFFIDQGAAPARVTLCITNILNSISLLVSTNKYIPNVPYNTWLTEFLMLNLVFTVIPMIEYGILNSCSTAYDQ
jgi:hypothetical protein